MPVTFPTTRLTVLVEIQLYDGTWADVSSYVHWSDRIVITRGRQPNQRRGVSNRCTLTFKNADKRFSPRNVTGPYHGSLKSGTPLRVSLDPGTGSVRRFTGAVPGWKPQVRGHPNDRRVTVTAVGPLDVIERDGTPLLSAPARYLPTTIPTAPLHYWRMEDGELADALGQPDVGATSLYPFVGTHPGGAVISVPQWGRGTLAPWLPPVLSRSGAAGLTVVAAKVSMPAGMTEWTIDLMYAMGTDVGADTVGFMGAAIDINPLYLGGALGWPQLQFLPSLAQFAVDISGTLLYSVVAPEAFDGNAHHLRWTVRQSGANVAWAVWIDGEQVTDAGVTAGAYTLPVVESIGLMAVANASSLAQGHLAIWSGTAPTLTTAVNVAFGRGRGTEGGPFRFGRLLDEEGVANTVNEVDADTQLMGPQRAAKLSDLLHECEDVNEGVIDETVDGVLRLNSRTARFSQAVALTLDYAAGDALPPLVPNDEIDQLYNDWTITRQDGATARYQVEDGPTSISAYPDGIGARPTSGTIIAYTDAQALAHASYRAHRDSVDQPRYDAIKVSLTGTPTLITAWLATDIGDRVQITSPPVDSGPDTVDTTLEGLVESIDQADWDLALYLEPGDISSAVGRFDAARYDCPGSTLNVSVDTTETAVKVAVNCVAPDVCRWAHDDGNYAVRCEGENMTVTAISSPAGTFVAAGTAAHADNASVTPGLPAGMVKGDLMLIFAAIRNTAATPAIPSGYSRLVDLGNAALFGKIHTGTESAPAVTFAGGSAGDTTSAQMSAFRDTQLSVVDAGAGAGGSTQDIATPVMIINRGRCVVLALGWKQDDWTSVAPPAGYTEIGEPSSTLGSDQGITWAYSIQGAPVGLGASAFTVTGGGVATVRSAIVTLACDVQTLTVTRSANSVVKAHSAGRRLSLATPTRWAL